MAKVDVSETVELIITGQNPSNQIEIARVLALLGDDAYREANKMDVCLVEDGYGIWALVVGRIWIAFVENADASSIIVVHLSLLSLFYAS